MKAKVLGSAMTFFNCARCERRDEVCRDRLLPSLQVAVGKWAPNVDAPSRDVCLRTPPLRRSMRRTVLLANRNRTNLSQCRAHGNVMRAARI